MTIINATPLPAADEEQEELMRLQRLFCVPPSDAKQISSEVLGRVYERVRLFLTSACSLCLQVCI